MVSHSEHMRQERAYETSTWLQSRCLHEKSSAPRVRPQVEEPISPEKYKILHPSSSTSWWNKNWKWAHIFWIIVGNFLSYSWIRLQSMANHCNRRVWRQIHFTHHFSHAHCTSDCVHAHCMAQDEPTLKVSLCAFSVPSSCHPWCVFERCWSSFSPSSTSSLPHSTCSLPSTLSSMSTTPRFKTAAHPHDEEYRTVAMYHPLTEHEPQTTLFRDFCSDLPWWSVDIHWTVVLMRCGTRWWACWGKRLSSPLFIQERDHSREKSLLPAQSFFTRTKTERPVQGPSSVASRTEINSRLRKRANQDSPWKTKKSKFSLKSESKSRNTNFSLSLIKEVSKN